MIDKMTKREEETLRKLMAKKKRMERHNQTFLEEADFRKEELLKRWSIDKDSLTLEEPNSLDGTSTHIGLCSDDDMNLGL